MKTYSSTKFEEARNYGTNQFNRLADIARLNAVIGVADSVVDKFLPEITAEEEGDDDTPAKAETVSRVSLLLEHIWSWSLHSSTMIILAAHCLDL